MMIRPYFKQYSTGEWFACIDGKRIARKSIFTARVYTDPYDDRKPFVTYESRIEHCGSCLSDNRYSGVSDECCSCVHGRFKNKQEENAYVKSIGFWKIPFSPPKDLNV